MPVVAERQAPKRGSRWAVWLLLALGTVLLTLAALPLFRPVVLHAGDAWLWLDGTPDPTGATGPQGWFSSDWPPGPGVELYGQKWVSTSTFRQRGVRVGQWSYAVSWFRGRKVQ